MELLEKQVSRDLGVPLLLALARDPWGGSSPRLERLNHPSRILAYRRGRAALACLLHRLCREDDPGSILFPHPEFSISHTEAFAVALACPGGRGVGVDLEQLGRRVPERGMRLYLTDAERSRHEASDDETRLRLWTVKEALFKAHLANEGLTLATFALDDPGAWLGTASGAGERFRYGSWACEVGWLAIATRL